MDSHVEVMDGQVYGWHVPPKINLRSALTSAASPPASNWERPKNPTPEQLGDAAFRRILAGRWSAVPSLMEAAVAESPRNAALLSDFAAVELNNPRGGDPPPRFRALSAALRAIQIDASLLEARFNLGLALEKCGLFEQAKSAWRDYLRLDPHSGWSDEARQHLADLRKPSPSQRWLRRWKGQVLAGAQAIPDELWEAAREESKLALLERWSSSVLRNDAKAAQAELSAVRAVAELLEERRHDSSVLRAVRDIDSANRHGATHSLAEGYWAFAQGERHYLRMELALARPYYQAAERLLARNRSPFEPWATVRLAEIACEAADYQRAQRLLLRIRSRTNPSRDPDVNSQQLWVDGQIHLNQAQLSAAASAFEQSHEAARDKEQQTKTSLSVAEAREPVGPNQWFSRSSARNDLNATSPLSHRFRFLDSFSRILFDVEPVAAEAVAREALSVAEMTGIPAWAVSALLQNAQMEARKNDWTRARSYLESADRWIAGIPDRSLNERLSQEALLARSTILRGALPEEQIQALKGVLPYWGRHNRLKLPTIQRTLAGAYRDLRQSRLYEEELHRALSFHKDLVRSWRISKSILKRRAGDLIGDLATVHLARGQAEVALSLEESARVFPGLPRRQSLPLVKEIPDPLENLGYVGANSRSYSVSEFSGGPPPDLAIVEFQHKGDRIWAWVFRRSRVRRYDLSVSVSTLRRHLPPSLSRPGYTYHYPRFHSKELSEWLLKPLHSSLPPEGDLVFLVGGLLDSVSWSQLSDPFSSRALMRDHGIVSTVIPDGVTTGGRLERATLVARSLLLGTQDSGAGVAQRQSSQWAEPLTARELKKRLPGTYTLVEYAFVGDQLVAWVIRSGEIRFASLPADRERCLRLVRRYLLSTVHGRARSVKALIDELGVILIDPIRPFLPNSGSLVFVPDEALLQLPFAALPIRRRGPPLLETYTISVATSATSYIFQQDDAQRSDHRTWRALVIANPISKETRTWDSTSAGAAREIAAISRLFPGSKAMEGFDAITSNPLLRESFEIVHYSGHWDLRHDPYDDTVKPGMLPEESKVQLAVLAGCRTGVDSSWHGPTSHWVPGRLLGRNVPAVIATLWGVDDTVTTHLMVRFYRHLHSGKDVAHALQAAQLELLRSKSLTLRKVTSWGGFQLYGYGGV